MAIAGIPAAQKRQRPPKIMGFHPRAERPRLRPNQTMTGAAVKKGALVSAAAAMLVAAPCNAAQDFRSAFEAAPRPAAFVGAVVRLELGRRGEPRPVARLRTAMIPSAGDPRAAARLATDPSRGIELGFTGNDRPELYVGGRSLSESTRRLGVEGSTKDTVLIVAGVTLILVTILVVSSLDGLGEAFPDFNDSD